MHYLVYYEFFSRIEEAIAREKEIKKWRREKKEDLVNSVNPLWNDLRNQTKFYRMMELGNALPKIRQQIQKDLALPGLSKNKVLATVISLMEKTGIRIGNGFYEKLYGSFGLTTLKNKHVDLKGGVIKFTFRGKKGVEHQVTLQSKKLSKIVHQCREIPGKELFQYIDEEGNRQSIESGMVNDYIKSIAEGEFTAKDFRTWCGSVAALNAIIEIGVLEDKKEAKQKIIEILDKVSLQLGNSRTVCKKVLLFDPRTSGEKLLSFHLWQFPESEERVISANSSFFFFFFA